MGAPVSYAAAPVTFAAAPQVTYAAAPTSVTYAAPAPVPVTTTTYAAAPLYAAPTYAAPTYVGSTYQFPQADSSMLAAAEPVGPAVPEAVQEVVEPTEAVKKLWSQHM